VIDAAEKKRLEEIGQRLRRHVMDMLYHSQSGHPGGSLSLADVMSVLYFHTLRYRVDEPDFPGRDRVVLSKGHAAPILYATLAEAGFFPVEELSTLRKTGSRLQGHPCIDIPGVDLTTGSLGLGLSGACGMAIGARQNGLDDVRVFAIVGDGELGEGQIWEAALAAPNFGLGNLTVVIDRNRYQNDGGTEEILTLEPLVQKWESFGWNTLEIDGHDIAEIAAAFEASAEDPKVPTAIVANTIKGKGVSYLIDRPELHYTAPNQDQRDQAIRELSGV